MTAAEGEPIEALLVAVPETAGSALYGMIDVLAATGCVWPVLTGTGSASPLIRPRICSMARDPFRCGNAIPVIPERVVADDPAADIVILPELWLAPDEPLTGRYPELMAWLRRRYAAGASLYAACSGSIPARAPRPRTSSSRRGSVSRARRATRCRRTGSRS